MRKSTIVRICQTLIPLCLLALVRTAYSANIGTLLEMIDQGHYSAEELLKQLPTDFLSRHTFVYKTHSPQGASPEYPRAIVFGSDASLLITFNGHASQSNFMNWDVLSWSKKDETYASFSIQFSAENKKPLITADPPLCKSCHSAFGDKIVPLRAIYQNGIYPGVVGSDHDRIDPTERTFLEKFLNKRRWEGRYRYLPSFSPATDWPNGKPNQMLGRLLNQKYFPLMAREIARRPAFYKVRYAVLAALDCYDANSVTDQSPPFDQFIPDSVKASFEFPYERFSQELLTQRRQALSNLINLRNSYLATQKDFPAFENEQREMASIALRYLAANLGISDPGFQAQLESLSQSEDGLGGVGNLAEYLFPYFLDPIADSKLYSIHQLAAAMKTTPYSDYNVLLADPETCKLLLESSRE
jgi:hypothetical protein